MGKTLFEILNKMLQREQMSNHQKMLFIKNVIPNKLYQLESNKRLKIRNNAFGIKVI